VADWLEGHHAGGGRYLAERVAAGALTATQLEAIIQRTDTRTILFAGGEFDALPGFRAWTQANFTLVEDFGEGRALYLKQATGPVPA
jgi:hypothetical protein